MKLAALVTLAAALALLAPQAHALPVAGTVLDRAGHALEYANVAAAAAKRGAVSDGAGRFSLDLPAGPVLLEVSQIGYERARLTVHVAEGMAPLRIVLADEPVALAEVTVATSSFGKAGKSEGAVLNRRDIVMTPGGAADVFQSLRALPGINAPNEGAALYVRGGDPSETMIRLDGGEIGHPYHYESASGGLFGAFDSYMLKDAFFSSGGFSARYGSVLSGVLDIETQDPMNTRTVTVGANLAGGNVSSSWALVPDKLSLVGTARYATPDLLFRLYGSASRYETVPRSRDGALRLLYRPSPTGRLSLTYLGAHDRVGVLARRLNFEAPYAQRAGNDLVALQVQDLVGGAVALKGQASFQSYRSDWSYSVFGAARRERSLQANLDAVWPASRRHELSFGVNLRRRTTTIAGTLAADSTDFGPGAPTRTYDTRVPLAEPGVYLEDKLRVTGPVYATVGGRLDYVSRPGVWTADPRAALAWRVNGAHALRLAAGRYHQPVAADYLDPRFGNPALPPLEAEHWIAGYEWRDTDVNLRVEAYAKRYRHLVTQDQTAFYASRGQGYARGVDFFLRGSHRSLAGWISYGYLDSKRQERDDPREEPASFGVRHSLTLVGTYQALPSWQIGARLGYSSGRPYRPVVGATYDAARGLWRPIYGENNSGRMPDYRRLDLRLTHLFSLPATLGLPPSSVCVFYVEGLNVLNLHNTLDYYYSADYTVRRAQDSYFSRRLLVGGVGLSW